MAMKIPATKPYFSPESIEFILSNFRDILEGKSFLSNFKFCKTFEEEFAEYHGVKYGATCSSGTIALELCMRGLNIRDRDVIVPSVTFSATAFAAMAARNRPVFADVGDDMCIDPDDVRRCITPNTAAVITVHIGGRVSHRLPELQALCKEKGLLLIEDAAHAQGSALNGQSAGSFGQASAFSFFSTKVITTGEGGMVVTNDEQVYDRACLIRDYAKKDGRNYHEEYGSSFRMSEVHALMGLTQLRELDAFVRRRQEIAKIFDDIFEDSELQVIKGHEGCYQNFYKYIALLPGQVDRTEITAKLKRDYGVSLGGPVYEVPLHEQPVFQSLVTRHLPVSSDLSRRHICPPIYFTMTDAEAKYSAQSIKSVVQETVKAGLAST